MTNKGFVIYARLTIVAVLFVILWGAYVRASGSGAGCGEHWPMCKGEVIPQSPTLKTMIEFSHRVTSGLSLLLVVGLFWLARRVFPVGHGARRSSAWALAFIFGEAGVGAMLVLLALVGHNDSVLRAGVIALHLLNTFLLLYWLTYCAHCGHTLKVKSPPEASWSRARVNLFLCLGFFAAIGAAGAVVALGDTLFPSSSLASGLAEDLSTGNHFLIRLRVIHPILAIFGSIYIFFQLYSLPRLPGLKIEMGSSRWVAVALLLQILLGGLNVLLLAPIWLQMAHLFAADVVWILLVNLYINSFLPNQIESAQLV
ncbi:MAG: COX15/CtaA family protein [Proteobacteria bacterium]|nr:COX15/CtaA family protein [Pseudomonadota bacterium]